MGIPVDLNQRTNSICKEGSSRYGEDKTKLVPGARIELATPAFSGRRSTNELPRHEWSRNCMGDTALCQSGGKHTAENTSVERRSVNQSADSSNSFIQLRFLRTSRGLVPSGGPTIPSFSIRSISRAARP